MGQIDGQLKCAQFENIAAATTTPTPTGRFYADTSISPARGRYYDGSGWRYLKTNKNVVTSVSTTYTALITDEIIKANANSAGFTINLPAAASFTGQIFIFKKTDSTLNLVTLDGNASETIDGATTFVLGLQNEEVEIISDGTNWIVLQRYIPNGTIGAPITTYTQLITDTSILANATSAAFTVTLLAAATLSGRILTIKKTDSTLNVVTIDGNASETIDGALTLKLSTQYEVVRIMSDGTNWQVIDRSIPSVWTAYTPTGSWSANTTYTAFWKRNGTSLELDINLALAGAPTSASLTVNLPTGLTIDTAQMTSAVAGNSPFLSSVSVFDTSASDTFTAFALYNSTTSIAIFKDDGDGTRSTVNATAPMTFASGDAVRIRVSQIPISGW